MKRMRVKGAALALLALVAGPAWAINVPSCVNLPNALCATGDDDATGSYRMTNATPFVFEGASDNAFETTLAITDPTADRTVTIPNADTSTAQAVSCGAGEHVSAFSATTGSFTCTPDAGGGGSHALLSATHTDTVAAAVTRGAIIVGNATPAWAAVPIGAANTFMGSNGTDATWTAISASHIGPGDLANAKVWNENCSASPCTLANAPRTADTALVIHHGLTLRRVTTCGGEGEYTLSGTTLTTCGEAWGPAGDLALVTYER